MTKEEKVLTFRYRKMEGSLLFFGCFSCEGNCSFFIVRRIDQDWVSEKAHFKNKVLKIHFRSLVGTFKWALSTHFWAYLSVSLNRQDNGNIVLSRVFKSFTNIDIQSEKTKEMARKLNLVSCRY